MPSRKSYVLLLPQYREAREAFSRMFTAVAVRQYAPVINEHLQVLLDTLATEQKNNANGFDIQIVYNSYAFDVISRFAKLVAVHQVCPVIMKLTVSAYITGSCLALQWIPSSLRI